MTKEHLNLKWRKATASVPDGCVELAPLPDGGVAVRDSKQEGKGPILYYTQREWRAFVDGMQKGEFADLVRAAAK